MAFGLAARRKTLPGMGLHRKLCVGPRSDWIRSRILDRKRTNGLDAGLYFVDRCCREMSVSRTMKTFTVVGTLLVVASAAGADIGSVFVASDGRPNAADTGGTRGLRSPVDLRTSTPVIPCPDKSSQLVADGPAVDGALRPDPPSAALCVTALFGLSAWQLGRSCRRINLAYVPEWYHAGPPWRIGSATALDPSFAVLPADLDGEAVIPEPLGERWLTHVRRVRRQYFVSIRCPRAPPARQ